MSVRVSIIIPFLNEEENISFLTESLSAFFADKKELQPQVVFVDDGSTDRSLALLKAAQHRHYSCKIISLSRRAAAVLASRPERASERDQKNARIPNATPRPGSGA